jgi:hypothetical protein
VPSLPSYYVDRPDARNRLKSALLNEEFHITGTLVISAIYGLGGIGKSVLASALAHEPEVQAKFPDGVLWVTLGQQPEILAFLSNWIQALRDFDYKPTTIDTASTHLRSLLRNKSLLLIVDDAWSAEAIEPFLVGGNGCRVLVTTREARIQGARQIYLEEMNAEESIALIENYLQRILTETERKLALKFSDAVGYLPLALDLAAGQVQDGVNWEDLLAAFKQEITYLEVLDSPDLEEATTEKARKQRSLTASFNLSLNRLKPELKEYFSWMGVLPEDISIGAEAMATIWDISLDNAQRTLRELRRRSLLLDGLAREKAQTYRMHDLIHDTARLLLQKSIGIEEAHRQICDRYQLKAARWWKISNDGYIYAHLTWHLEKANLICEIHELLRASNEQGRNAWFEVCDRVGQPAIFVQDVTRAWRLADKLWEQEPGQATILQVRYALIMATLNSLANNLPDELISALVKSNYWTAEQGLFYAERVQEEWHRGNIIIELVPYLSYDFAIKAIEIACTIERDDTKNNTLYSIKEKFPQLFLNFELEIYDPIEQSNKQTNLLDSLGFSLDANNQFDTLEKISILEDEFDKTDAICLLAKYLDLSCLEKVFQITKTIEDEYSFAQIMCSLAEVFPDLRDQAWQAILSVKDEKFSALIYCEALKLFPNLVSTALTKAEQHLQYEQMLTAVSLLVSYLDEEQFEQIIDYIFACSDEKYQAMALETIAPYIPSHSLKMIVERANLISYEPDRISALNSLVNNFSVEQTYEYIKIMRQINDQYEYVLSLTRLSTIFSYLMPQLLELSYTILNEYNYYKILVILIKYLPPEYLPLLLDSAYRIQFYNDYRYVLTLAELAKRDPIYLPKVIEEMNFFEEEDQAAIMTSLADKFPKYVNHSLKKVLILDDIRSKSNLLIELIPHLNKSQLKKVEKYVLKTELNDLEPIVLIKLAQRIPSLLSLAIERVNSYSYSVPIWYIELAKISSNFLPDAIKICSKSYDLLQNCRLLQLVTYFPELLSQIMEEYPVMQWENLEVSSLKMLADSLLPELLLDAFNTIKQMNGMQEKAEALSAYVYRLSPSSMTYQDWQEILSILSALKRPNFLLALPDLIPFIQYFGDNDTPSKVVQAMQEVYGQWN